MSKNKRTILFAAANPVDRDKLATKKEFKKVKKLGKIFDESSLFSFKFIDKLCVDKLVNKVQIHDPNILHLANHGTKNGDMVVEDKESRKAKEICYKAFGNFFEYSQGNLDLVFLNSCYSVEQAVGVSKYIPHVVAMSTRVPDDFAIRFASDFYTMLFKKKDYFVSFAYAHNNLLMTNSTKEKINIPKFYSGGTEVPLKKIKEKPNCSSEDISRLRVEVEDVIEKGKSLSELRAQHSKLSRHKTGLAFLLKNMNFLSKKTAKHVLPGKKFKDQADRALLELEIINILEYVHDSILVEDKEPLNKRKFRSGFEGSNVLERSMNEIINFIHNDEILESFDKSILIEYISFYKKQSL